MLFFKKINIFIISIIFIFVHIIRADAGLWTRQSGDLLYSPQFQKYIFPAQVGQIKARIADDGDNPHPYIQTGIFFPKGKVTGTFGLTAKNYDGTPYPLQMQIHNRYSDNSVRFAVVIIKINNPKPNKIYDIALIAENADINQMTSVTPVMPDIQVTITAPTGQSKTISLTQAMPEKMPYQTGFLKHQIRYNAPVFKGLNIDFDVETFENNTQKVDIIFNYNDLKKTPMRNASYGVIIKQQGKIIADLKNIIQNHHSKWRYPVYIGYKMNNVVTLNMQDMIKLNVVPAIDISYGVHENAVNNDFEISKQSSKDIASNLQSTGLITPYMPGTGGRDDLGLMPQWISRYISTSDDRSRYAMLKNAEISSYIPWIFIDENTKNPALPSNYPNLWIDDRARLDTHGIEPYSMQGTKWTVDSAHQPSLLYVPYIITGDRYYYDTLKSIYMFNRFTVENFQTDKRYRTQYIEQVRGYGWFMRTAGEMQSILNEKDIDFDYITNQNKKDTEYLQTMFIKNGAYNFEYGKPITPLENVDITGETTGFLMAYGSDTDKENPVFMQDFAALGIGYNAAFGFDDELKSFLDWQSNFVSGRFLQKHNGYPPIYGTAYKFIQYITDDTGYNTVYGKKRILNKWRDIFDASIKSGYFDEMTAQIQNGELPGYEKSADGYPAYAAAANAQIFNVTANPQVLEAYGFLAQYLERAAEEYYNNPTFLTTPKFDDGLNLRFKDILVGSESDDDLPNNPSHSLVHGGAGDDEISIIRSDDNDELRHKTSTGFLFGGDGNDILSAGDVKSFLYGGDGNDILIAGPGNDILKGDENYGTGKDIFKFSGKTFGKNTILDFTVGKDKIQFTPDTGIVKYAFNNHLEGIAADKRDMPIKYDVNCPNYSEFEQKNRPECDKYVIYRTSYIADADLLKELQPELPQDLKDRETAAREQLNLIDENNNPVQYRQAENNLKSVLNEKEVFITKMIANSQFGDKSATKKLRPQAIRNVGVENYIRPAPDGGTIIDFDVNITPQEQKLQTENPFGHIMGSILLKNISPEELSSDDFIFAK